MRPPLAGVAEELAPGVVRLLAPNPSPMTHWGTNSYLIGENDLAVIDPGPALPDHLAALEAAIAGRVVRAVLVTHAHLDHSPLAAPLAARLGAPVMGFGPAPAGRSAVMARLAAEGDVGGGEGVDTDFAPDQPLADGGEIAGAGWRLTALHTPGHFAGHLSFALGRDVFSGDHAMGWASSLISPPDGDVASFRASCQRLIALGATRLLPGHGALVEDGVGRLAWLLAHRAAREAEILAALAPGPATIPALTRRLYTETPPALRPAAERNVFAHLIDLTERMLVTPRPRLRFDAHFERR